MCVEKFTQVRVQYRVQFRVNLTHADSVYRLTICNIYGYENQYKSTIYSTFKHVEEKYAHNEMKHLESETERKTDR